jgi:hypothetical protein
LNGDQFGTALRKLETPINVTKGPGPPELVQVILAWRDHVLLKEPVFRDDTYIQEQSYEVQLRYLGLILLKDSTGVQIKKEIARHQLMLARLGDNLVAGAGIPVSPMDVALAFDDRQLWSFTPINNPSLLRGPYEINVLEVDERDSPAAASWLVGLGGGVPMPLLNASALAIRSKPLISAGTINVVRDRKGMTPRKSVEASNKPAEGPR